MAGYIHDDVKEIMDEATNPQAYAFIRDFTKAQLKCLDILLQYSWNRGYKSAEADYADIVESSYIHDDIKEIMDEAANPQASASTHNFTKDQLKRLDILMQYAWNRGYKSACADINE